MKINQPHNISIYIMAKMVKIPHKAFTSYKISALLILVYIRRVDFSACVCWIKYGVQETGPWFSVPLAFMLAMPFYSTLLLINLNFIVALIFRNTFNLCFISFKICKMHIVAYPMEFVFSFFRGMLCVIS